MSVEELNTKSSEPQADQGTIGSRIRACRQSLGWTLYALAQRAGLSKSFISRLEDGDRQPSIAALISISRALGISVGDLTAQDSMETRSKIVHGNDAPVMSGNGLTYQSHNGDHPNPAMQPLRITVTSGRDGDELYRHDGEEWLYVLSGVLILTLGNDVLRLCAGDSIYFDATVGHRLTADGAKDVEAILVASLGKKSLLSSYL